MCLAFHGTQSVPFEMNSSVTGFSAIKVSVRCSSCNNDLYELLLRSQRTQVVNVDALAPNMRHGQGEIWHSHQPRDWSDFATTFNHDNRASDSFTERPICLIEFG